MTMPASSTADEILRSARTLIVAGGYSGFSYADIAAEVGIRKASIHHHFPTKLNLVCTLVARYRAEFAAGVAEIERHSDTAMDRILAYTGFWESCIDDPTSSFCVCALLAAEIPSLPAELADELTAHFRELSAWVRSVLERGKRDGSISVDGDIHSEAETFMASVHGAMLSARAYRDPDVFQLITRTAVRRFTPQK
jgi:TetR/AcrR family transcriptional regulator, transcriptional repressor for nem operon